MVLISIALTSLFVRGYNTRVYTLLLCARSPVDRTLASGAESGSSALPERTSKTRISIVRENLRCLIVSIIEGTR